MACVIYREGKGTIENGIECESTTCEIEHLEGLLASGWSHNPPGYEAPEPVEDGEPEGEDGSDVDDDADLAEQVASLTAQLEIMKEMDEKSRTEIDRLTEELRKADEDNAAQAEEIIRLNVARLEGIELNQAGDSNDGDDDSTNLNPVRIAAKEAGIEGWETKRIATLQTALDSLKDEQGE